ncbi:hypothetical protein [Microbacterium sp. K24]|uniref:hypothetical protein n=1 Tax=Microbacterium sp. K24 TaxID=2305446 RepID=UPI00109CC7DD|nr:hypothetical protein [Microbacterium sp. K24]
MFDRFAVELLDNDGLFQTLVREVTPERAEVAGNLDVGSYAEIPLVTHYSVATQEGNANGLWTVTLTLNIFDDPKTAYELVRAIYKGVWAWEDPTKGIVPGVGAIESLDQEISAFSRVGGQAQMETKAVIQYSGSWNFTARNH